jgi:oxygen-dependent protoporphyrinogen oxidase
MPDRRALIVGGGIAGLAAAIELAGRTPDATFDATFDHIEIRESAERTGGRLLASPFAGLDHVDEGADAYLLRVPDAGRLATEVGITDIVSPTAASAAVWHDGLHAIPGGIVLGMPAAVRPFATSSLLSWRGKLRAGLEPILPRRDHDDALGALVRYRFGKEVHERLVDALVGSIYAADTDRWSLAAVPQLASLAAGNRSLLLAARAARRAALTPDAAGPVFGAPRDGMGSLAAAAAAHARDRGVVIHTGRPVDELAADGDGWRVDDDRFDAVVLAVPAPVAGSLLAGVAPEVAADLAGIPSADVIMVRLVVPDWPAHCQGRSGYLVPKPDQRYVTAASFASQKWAHWQPPEGGQLVRVSLGRDGLPVMHLDDDEVTDAVVTELGRHLDHDVQPSAISITRWPAAFPQYRPHHADLVARAVRGLPPGLAVAGAAYHGIGVPACIASGRRAAANVKQSTALADGDLT